MRIFLALAGVYIFCLQLEAQVGINANTPWRFIKGDSTGHDVSPVYGEQGFITEGNRPGAREECARWTDNSGNLWLFGGYGISSINQGILNDLWKYDKAMNQWIFMKGDNIMNVHGIYGVKGDESDDNNKPGARTGSSSWIDASGNLWLFGGNGMYTGGVGKLNDLWKYNPTTNRWTWMKGDNSKDVNGVYETKGNPTEFTNPGGRHEAFSWVGADGKLWLFGGEGFSKNGSLGRLNDLWSYDTLTNEWTWVNGADSSNATGVYGMTGGNIIHNKPGARNWGASWADNTGNLFLFGGYGCYDAGLGWFNDLWKYVIATDQWTWIKGDSNSVLVDYGVQGVEHINNKPGARHGAISLKDNTGKFWLFGGYGYADNGEGNLNDLWRYNPANNQWTWMEGQKTKDGTATYGTKFIASSANSPGAASSGQGGTDNDGNLWIFGGAGYSTESNYFGYLGALWKYNILSGNWTWMKGDSAMFTPGIYGQPGFISDGNRPGARKESISWKDNSGNLWMFGGGYANGPAATYFDDVWKYDPGANQWLWMKGHNSTNWAGIYGVKNIPNPNNNPGSRRGGVSWKDVSGNFWMFGGEGLDLLGNQGLLNDLWKYNVSTGEWTWIKGDSVRNSNAIYGTILSGVITNKPGGRTGSVSWTDAAGKFWLFGGYGITTAGNTGFLNDLWKYDPVTNIWTWMSGNNTNNNISVYGVKGNETATNKVGARSGSITWIDGSGRLWLFGGFGYTGSATRGSLNDLWRFNTSNNQWTWISGDDYTHSSGQYGVQGTTHINNRPSARRSSISWIDTGGNLWLFGGADSTVFAEVDFYNDLWKYDPVSDRWTWMKGDSIVDAAGIPGTKGVSSDANKPMSKEKMVPWIDNAGNFWMYGGVGIGWWGNIDDLWKYNPLLNQWTWIKGETSFSDPGIFGTKGVAANANMPGAKEHPMSWTDSTGNLWLFGGGIIHQVDEYRMNDLWKFVPEANQWTWMKGDSLPNGKALYMGQQDLVTPGARQGGVTWVDQAGKLWLFGGQFVDRNTHIRTWYNDLWKYDPTNNTWTWVKGDTIPNVEGLYLNSNLDAVKPGAREGAVSWIDNSGNLWMFGGSWNMQFNISNYNDLWKYNIASNRWQWMAGDSTYNNDGVYTAGGKPGARIQGSGWTDSAGNLYLFGGNKFDNSGNYLFNDLWKYDITGSTWIWLRGSSSFNALSNLGTTGVPNPLNDPGARAGCFAWKDVYGNIFLFGGYGNSSYAFGRLNDFWMYDISSNEWIFLNGDELYANSNVNKPGARYLGAQWSDPYGDLWLFGGFGSGTTGGGFLNDLWKIYSGTKYVFIGDGSWSNAANWEGNSAPPTTIIPGMDVTIDHLIPGECINNGPITVQPFGRLRVESGKKLTIDQGDLLNAGTIEGPGNRPGLLRFTGLSNSALESIGFISTPIVLDNKKMHLSGHTIVDSIRLSGGSTLKLDGYNLNIGKANLTGDSLNFIITNNTGRLIRTVETNKETVFHIGADSVSYSPVTILNAGVEDYFKVRVDTGVKNNNTAVLTGNVNRTWLIADSIEGNNDVTLKIQWKAGNEQNQFLRGSSYISHVAVCPKPDNCSGEYFDRVASDAATDMGQGYFSLQRTAIDSFRTNSFIVTSNPFVYTFTGGIDSDWNKALNWTPAIVPTFTIDPGMEVIINHGSGGQCIASENIVIKIGGKLTVQPGKTLKVGPN